MAVGYIQVVLLVLCIDHSSSASGSTIPPNVTPASSAVNCEFKLTDKKIRDELNKADAKLIKYHIRFKDYPDDILTLKGGTLVRPNIWLRTTNSQGQSLLMLNENFEMLSLSLLGIGVINIPVELYDTPYGCMNNLGSEERVNKTRKLLLNDFKIPGPGEKSGSLDEDERICTMYIEKTSDNHAEYKYVCCHIDPDGDEICEDIEQNVLINGLLVSIFIVTILVGLFSPWFIPESMYREKYTTRDYIHKFPDGPKKLRIKVVKTETPKKYVKFCKNRPVSRENVEDLDPFKRLLETMYQLDTKYDLKVGQIRLSVKSRKLLPENDVPVSTLKEIYENIFRCQMRKNESLKPCCDTVLFLNITIYKCFRVIAGLFLSALVVLPWVIRLVIYFCYEAPDVEEKKAVADKLNLHVHYSIYRLYRSRATLYLTPLHVFFIITYVFIMIDSCAYGILNKGIKKHRFNSILKKCLLDTREKSQGGAYNWALRLFVYPIKKYRCGGCLLAPIFWLVVIPFVIPVMVFYTFPFLNLFIRFLIQLIFLTPCGDVFRWFYNKWKPRSDEKNSQSKTPGLVKNDQTIFYSKECRNLCYIVDIVLQIIIILICLASLVSMTFLLMECATFFVEIGVYTLMGIILNSGVVLQYLSLLLLICLYAYDSFSGIYKKYLDYHKKVMKLLLQKTETEIRRAVLEDESTQKNVAFRVRSPYCKAPYCIENDTAVVGVRVKDGQVRWETTGLLVFLDKKDQPFTPTNFFHRTIDMNYFACPGKIYMNNLKAFKNFARLLFFLVFVIIVVLAFGTQLSSTNQLLATLAGGFVPFAVNHFFKREAASLELDADNIHFQSELDKAIFNLKQAWPIAVSAENSPAGEVVEWESEYQTTENKVDLIIDVSTKRRHHLIGMREPLKTDV